MMYRNSAMQVSELRKGFVNKLFRKPANISSERIQNQLLSIESVMLYPSAVTC